MAKKSVRIREPVLYKFRTLDIEFLPAICPRQEVSENTNREFAIRTDFLPYSLRISALGYLLPGTSTGTRVRVPLAWDPSRLTANSFSPASNYGIIGTTHQDIKSKLSSHRSRHTRRRSPGSDCYICPALHIRKLAHLFGTVNQYKFTAQNLSAGKTALCVTISSCERRNR